MALFTSNRTPEEKAAKAKFSRMTIGKFSELTDEEISGMTAAEGRELLIKMRSSLGRRINNIERSGMYSHATVGLLGGEDRLKREFTYLGGSSDTPIEKMYTKVYKEMMSDVSLKSSSVNDLRSVVTKLRNFTNMKTSSLKGIKEVNRAQDIRIFGANKRGTPVRRLDNEQRKLLWKLYGEFQKQHNPGEIYKSTQIQEHFGEAVDKNIFGSTEFDEIDVTKALLDALEELQKKTDTGEFKGFSNSGKVYTT